MKTFLEIVMNGCAAGAILYIALLLLSILETKAKVENTFKPNYFMSVFFGIIAVIVYKFF